MIMSWIGFIVGVIIVVACIAWFVWAARERKNYGDSLSPLHKPGAIIVAILGVALAFWSLFWLYGTEPGQRAQKSFFSETDGGIERIVEVYDMEGDLITSYEGTFDIEYDEERIMFDMLQEDGSYKRIQIWAPTGTVTVEEK